MHRLTIADTASCKGGIMFKRVLLAFLLALLLLAPFAGCLKIGGSSDENKAQIDANAGRTRLQINK